MRGVATAVLPAETPVIETDRQAKESQLALAHLPALDGLRGIAILMVIVYHATPVPPEGWLLTAWHVASSWLWSGVDLFFVLSGFLITRILLVTRDDAGYFRKFYARRTLRIFPLYYGVLVALFVLLPLMVMVWPAGERILASESYQHLQSQQIYLWTYTHNFLQAKGPSQLPGFGHFWSLAVEEQFYLVWPLVVWWLASRANSTKGLAIFCVALCALTLILRVALLQAGSEPWAVFHWTFTRVDTLAYGALAACLYQSRYSLTGAPPSPARQGRDRVAYGLIAASFVALLICGILNSGWHKTDYALQTIGFSLFGIFYAALLFCLAAPERQANRLLNNRLLRTLGKYSYAMYVFHWPLCRAAEMLCRRVGLPLSGSQQDILLCRLIELTIALVLSFAAAWISWQLWERHWLKLKRYWAY